MPDEIKLRRSELYAKVWETPISRLAAELGISDVRLRSACLRHDIPLPALGHWARLAAGQKVGASPLPRPAEDDAVGLQPAGTRRRLHEPQPTAAPTRNPFTIPETLDRCHPLVKKTAGFFAKVRTELARHERLRLAPTDRPRRDVQPQSEVAQFRMGPLVNGRITSLGEGRLHIVATLGKIDWILRFHDALVRCLIAHELRIVPVEEPTGRVEVIGRGGCLTMSFMEEFRKRRKPGSTHYEYTSKDSYKLQFHLRRSEAPKTLQGTQAELENALTTVGETVSRWLAEEAEIDKLHIEREKTRFAAAQRRAETDARLPDQELARMRNLERRAQVDRLLQARKAHEEHVESLRLLAELTERAPGDVVIQTWAQVVRDQLVDPYAELLQMIRAEAASEHRPLWWPEPQGWAGRD